MNTKTPNPKYLEWTCRCGASYALEFNAPTTHRCQKQVGYDNKGRPLVCGAEFPNQEQRNKMQAAQFGVVIPA